MLNISLSKLLIRAAKVYRNFRGAIKIFIDQYIDDESFPPILLKQINDAQEDCLLFALALEYAAVTGIGEETKQIARQVEKTTEQIVQATKDLGRADEMIGQMDKICLNVSHLARCVCSENPDQVKSALEQLWDVECS